MDSIARKIEDHFGDGFETLQTQVGPLFEGGKGVRCHCARDGVSCMELVQYKLSALDEKVLRSGLGMCVHEQR